MTKHYIVDGKMIAEVSEIAFMLLEDKHFDGIINFWKDGEKATICSPGKEYIELEIKTLNATAEQIAEKLGLAKNVARAIAYRLLDGYDVCTITLG